MAIFTMPPRLLMHPRFLSALIALVAFAGCAGIPAYSDGVAWRKQDEVKKAEVHKIETDLAAEFCSAWLGRATVGCAVRSVNPESQTSRCVIVVPKGNGYVTAHEAGHCLGYAH